MAAHHMSESSRRASTPVLSLSDGDKSLLTRVLGERNTVVNLSQGDDTRIASMKDAMALLRELQTALDHTRGELGRYSFRRRAHRLMRNICHRFDLTPPELFNEGVQCDTKVNAVFGGGHADIYQGLYLSRPVALKRLRIFLQTNLRSVQQLVRREAIMWRHLHHPHLLPFLGIDATTFAPAYALVSPWMKNGNLTGYIRDNNLMVSHLNKLLKQTADGLAYLHRMGMVHGDLRAANVLIDDTGAACLADFGLTHLATTSTAMTTATGSMSVGQTNVRWTSPELLKGETTRSTSMSDVYAFGCVCYEVYTLDVPFGSISREAAVIAKIFTGESIQRPSLAQCHYKHLSDRLWDLMQECWMLDAEERPTAAEAKGMLGDIIEMSRADDTFQQMATRSLDPESSAEGDESSQETQESSEDDYHHLTSTVTAPVVQLPSGSYERRLPTWAPTIRALQLSPRQEDSSPAVLAALGERRPSVPKSCLRRISQWVDLQDGQAPKKEVHWSADNCYYSDCNDYSD